jgi:hypothetical protein
MNSTIELQRAELSANLFRCEGEYSLLRALNNSDKTKLEEARVAVREAREKLASHHLGVYLASRKTEIPNFYPNNVGAKVVHGWAWNIADAIQVHTAILVHGPDFVIEAIAGVWWANKIPTEWRQFFAELIKVVEWKYSCQVNIGVNIEFC